MPDLEQLFNYIGVSLGGLGVGGYTVHRLLKRDSNNDKIDSKTQYLIDHLTNQLNAERAHAAQALEKERDHSAHLGTVIDRISLERNEAVQSVGSLRNQIQLMGEQITMLKNEVQKQELINIELTNSFSQLRDEFVQLSKAIKGGSAA